MNSRMVAGVRWRKQLVFTRSCSQLVIEFPNFGSGQFWVKARACARYSHALTKPYHRIHNKDSTLRLNHNNFSWGQACQWCWWFCGWETHFGHKNMWFPPPPTCRLNRNNLLENNKLKMMRPHMHLHYCLTHRWNLTALRSSSTALTMNWNSWTSPA